MKKLIYAFTIALFVASANLANAQPYPDRPVRLVVGVAAGGGVDAILNIIRSKLIELWGQQIIIDNRPGAGGIAAAKIVSQADPDGYTLLFGMISNFAITPALYKKLPYDHIKDFTPVTLTTTAPNVLVVTPSIPPNNMREFIAYAKANPNKINFGSSGIGSSMHLSMELLDSLAGIKMVHVPYRGTVPAIMDLFGGRIQAICANLPSQLANIQSGAVRALAVTSAKRSPQLPDVPTFIESGIPLEVLIWHGIFAPTGLPPAILHKLNADIVKVLNMPDVRRRLGEQGVDAHPTTPQELAAFVKSETAKWTKAVKISGARVE